MSRPIAVDHDAVDDGLTDRHAPLFDRLEMAFPSSCKVGIWIPLCGLIDLGIRRHVVDQVAGIDVYRARRRGRILATDLMDPGAHPAVKRRRDTQDNVAIRP